MEIHRPKPFHGWRELAKEIGVISVGIAIALGGEQALEWLHNRAEVAEARETLRSEIAANAGMARYTIEQERCLHAGLDRLATMAAKGETPPPRPNDDPIPLLRPRMSTWEVVKSGAAAHMPLREREAYSRIYDDAQVLVENIDVETPLLLRLGHAMLPPTDKRETFAAMADLRLIGTARSGNSRHLLDGAKTLGVAPEPVTREYRESLTRFCGLVGITPEST